MRKLIIGGVLLAGAAAIWLVRSARQDSPTISSGALPAALQRTHPAHYIADPEDRRTAARIVPWGPRDYFRVIDSPRYLIVADAAPSMNDSEVVLGLSIGGESRAYPINYLNDHEMVSDEVAGTPILATW